MSSLKITNEPQGYYQPSFFDSAINFFFELVEDKFHANIVLETKGNMTLLNYYSFCFGSPTH